MSIARRMKLAAERSHVVQDKGVLSESFPTKLITIFAFILTLTRSLFVFILNENLFLLKRDFILNLL